MAKSQQTFSKKEKEIKRLKKRKEKEEKKSERKANAKGGDLESMLAYLDENGNIVDSPPDPTKKVEIDADSIVLGTPKKEDEEPKVYEGKVSFYDGSKGFGFILDNVTQEKYFVHFSKCVDKIAEGDKVSFDVEKGVKGLDAVNVKKI